MWRAAQAQTHRLPAGRREQGGDSTLSLPVKAIASKVRAVNSLPVTGAGNAETHGPTLKFNRVIPDPLGESGLLGDWPGQPSQLPPPSAGL